MPKFTLPKAAPTMQGFKNLKAIATTLDDQGLVEFQTEDGQIINQTVLDLAGQPSGLTFDILYTFRNGKAYINNASLRPEGSYKLIEDYYFSPQAYAVCDTATKIIEAGQHCAVAVYGPSGVGKTALAEAWAAHTGFNYHVIHMSLMAERTDMFGQGYAENGTTGFWWSEFVDVLEQGHAIVAFDDANRSEVESLNTQLSLMDHQGFVTVMGRRITTGPQVIFVSTCNIGYQYVGTQPLDFAFENRHDLVLKLGFLPKEIDTEMLQKLEGLTEPDAEKLASIMYILRKTPDLADIATDLSTRRIRSLAKLVRASDFVTAVKYGLITRMPAEVAQTACDAIRSLVHVGV